MMTNMPPNLFILHPENAYLVGGKRQWKVLWRGLTIIGFVIGMMLISWRNEIPRFFNERRLAQMEQQTAVGEVITLYSDSTYWITYRFTVGIETYTREEEVRRDYYRDLLRGSQVSVTYAVSDPSIFRLADNIFDDTGIMQTFATTLFVSTVIYVLLNLPAWLRHRHFQRHGRLIYGEIIKISSRLEEVPFEEWRRSLIRRRFHITVKYSFYPSPEKQIQDEAVAVRNDLIDQNLPAVGTSIAVAYIDDSQFMLI